SAPSHRAAASPPPSPAFTNHRVNPFFEEISLMQTRLSLAVFLVLSGTALGQSNSAPQARLLRFPTIHEDRIVFSYGGDLYPVDAQGGGARRLTTHEGFEMSPRFSPDGKWIAFTGQYDGNTEAYLMPSEGGKPKRLTYTATLGRDDVSDRMG